MLIHTHMHVHTHAYTHARAHTHVHTHARAHIAHTHAHTHTCTHVHAHTSTHVDGTFFAKIKSISYDTQNCSLVARLDILQETKCSLRAGLLHKINRTILVFHC